MEYKVISADNHLIEPRDMFIKGLPAKYKDRAPRVVRAEDGGDGWSWNGQKPKRTFGIEAVAGRESRAFGMKWEEILPGNYDGKAHIEDMQKDHVDAAVLYPSTSIDAYIQEDREFGQALMRAYNDWVLDEFTAVDRKRLIGLPLLPMDDGNEACIAEVRRCLDKGAKGFFVPAYPKIPYWEKHYDPLWEVLSAADVCISQHRTNGGKPPGMSWNPHIPGVNVGGTVVRFFSGVETMTYMIYCGVFERHPNLKYLMAEVNFGWIPFWKQTMDQLMEQQRSWSKVPLKGMPSDALGKNMFVTVLDDKAGFDSIRFDPQMADTALFSIDYPHSVCLWPNSQDYIAKCTVNVDPVSKAKVLSGNAVKLFHL